MFCMLLFNFVYYVYFCYVYVFLVLCMFRSRYCISLRCSVLFICKCVLYYCQRLSTQLRLSSLPYIISNKRKAKNSISKKLVLSFLDVLPCRTEHFVCLFVWKSADLVHLVILN